MMANNVIPFRRSEQRVTSLDYGPGVAPFDRTNPAHIKAWNTIWAWAKMENEYPEERV